MTEISRRGVLPNVGYKSPVVVATIAPITLFGPQTIDTVVLDIGDRVLVKNQVNTAENGIYNVTTGTWTRSVDFDDRDDVVTGVQVLNLRDGAVYAASFTGVYIPGTTLLTWGSVTASPVWGNVAGTLSAQTDLQAALDGKASSSHSHIIGDVTGLQAALDSKATNTALTTHTGDGTIHFTQAAITIAQSQVTGLVTALAAKAPLVSPTFTGTVSAADLTLTGALTTPASTTTRAGFNIPEGVAPTDPLDGDFWITAAGAANMRLNGVTVDLAAGGGGGIGGSITNDQIAVGAATANNIEGTSNLTFTTTNFTARSTTVTLGPTAGSTAQHIIVLGGGAVDLSRWEKTALQVSTVGSLTYQVTDDSGTNPYAYHSITRSGTGVGVQVDNQTFNVETGVVVNVGGTAKFTIVSTGAQVDSGGFAMVERADHARTPVATIGEFWVRNDVPCVPVFTDDAGTDHVLNASGVTETFTSNFDPDIRPATSGSIAWDAGDDELMVLKIGKLVHVQGLMYTSSAATSPVGEIIMDLPYAAQPASGTGNGATVTFMVTGEDLAVGTAGNNYIGVIAPDGTTATLQTETFGALTSAFSSGGGLRFCFTYITDA